MKTFKSLLAIVAISAIFVVLPVQGANHWTPALKKSLSEAQEQCATYLRLDSDTLARYIREGYPCEDQVRKLVRCTLLNLNVWDDETGVKTHAIVNFFTPIQSDTCYQSRTDNCLRENVDPLPIVQVEQRAYQAFQCYYRYYGNVVEEPQYIPNSLETRREFFRDAVTIANIPRPIVEQFSVGKLIDEEHFRNVLYVHCIRAGYYDPKYGFNLKHVATEFNVTDILSEKVEQCQRQVREQCYEEPQRMWQTFKQCHDHQEAGHKIAQLAAKEYLEETEPLCGDARGTGYIAGFKSSPFPKLNFCYNGQC